MSNFDQTSIGRSSTVFSASWLMARAVSYCVQVRDSLWMAMRRWQMDDGASMAAAVAYYLALSLFPMLLLLTAGVGLLMRFTALGHDAEAHLLAVIAEHCSASLEAQVKDVLLQVREQAVVSCPLGLATAVLAAIGVFYQFERAFDKIWRIPPAAELNLLQSGLRLVTTRLTAFLLLGCLALALMAILLANIVIGTLREWMSALHMPGTVLITIVDMSATTLLNTVAFATIYKWLPKRPVRWDDAMRGGLLVALVWEVGRQVLSAVLIGMKYTTAYGAIGSFIALLLWFYWGVTILFFGAEYVQVLSRRHQRPYKMFEKDSETSDYSEHKIRPRRAA